MYFCTVTNFILYQNVSNLFSFYHFFKIVHEKGLNFLAIQICDTIFENQGAMDTNRRQVFLFFLYCLQNYKLNTVHVTIS